MERNVYPFSAIVGQEDMKLALLLNLINPALGGVLIRGEKGTAKSTAVRGLCDLTEEIDVVKGCAFHCQPGRPPLCADCEGNEHPETVRYRRRVVELPISATEDRVVGSLNIEEAIRKGKKEFEPGILAEANGNFSTWTRSIFSTIILWTFFWIPQPWVSIRWSGKASHTAIPPGLCWWAP